ncbi:MAG: rhodanese-like domain-containing protein [Flavobacteriales bacterium]
MNEDMHQNVPTLSPSQVHQWKENGTSFAFLDIREIHEVTVSRLTDFHIPMAFCLSRQAEIPRELPVILYCRAGGRSAATVSALITKFGFENLYSLEGGISAWCAQYDPGTEVA